MNSDDIPTKFSDYLARLEKHEEFIKGEITAIYNRPEQKKILEKLPKDLSGDEKARKDLASAIKDGLLFHIKNINEKGSAKEYIENFLVFDEASTFETIEGKIKAKKDYTKNIDDFQGLILQVIDDYFQELKDFVKLQVKNSLIKLSVDDLEISMPRLEQHKLLIDVGFVCPEKSECKYTKSLDTCPRRLSWKVFLKAAFDKFKGHIIDRVFNITNLENANEEKCSLRVDYKRGRENGDA